MRLADFVVTCTDYNRRHLEGLTNGEVKVNRIYHGIDVNLFSTDGREPLARPPYRLLTVARMAPKKGLPTVYRALRMLADQGLEFHHVLIGDGDDRDKILELIKDLDLQDRTEWAGTKPHHFVVDEFKKADLFVLGCEVADNGDRDGIPNVFIEAMAMGVPVAATDVSAISEAVVPGETGLLAEPGDPEELAANIKRLLTDQDLRKRLIEQGRQKARSDFDNRALINDLADLYRRAGLG